MGRKKTDYSIGDIFGFWTIIDHAETRNKQAYVKVRCTCGREDEKAISALVYGKTTGCRKCVARSRYMSPIEVGKTYKKWTVIEGPIPYPSLKAKGGVAWKCQCHCGTIRIHSGWTLLQEKGCFECAKCARARGSYTRMVLGGCVGTLTIDKYNKWRRSAIRRGHDWDVSLEYLNSVYESQGKRCAYTGKLTDKISQLSIDRIDNNKGYIEGNIQFITNSMNTLKGQHGVDYLINMANNILKVHDNQQPSQRLKSLEGSETNS